eukprot:GHVR01016131.1.p1 GENE.GHVR01016131.1~~GHVR01016131.1.p1  ORF type:complete len:361 (+),score=99.47 GHVR01016131.1:108-1190(+)
MHQGFDQDQIVAMGLPPMSLESEVYDWASSCGEILHFKQLLNKSDRGSYAFITYATSEDARRAVNELPLIEFGGRRIRVEFQDPDKAKKPRPQRPPPTWQQQQQPQRPFWDDPRKPPRPSTCVFLPEGGIQIQASFLERDITDSALKQVLERTVGSVLDVRLFTLNADSPSSSDLTYGLIQMKDREQADAAIQALDGVNGWSVRFSNAFLRSWLASSGREATNASNTHTHTGTSTHSGVVVLREVIVYGVPDGVSDKLIKTSFSFTGEIESVEVLTRGRAYVRYCDATSANRAVKQPSLTIGGTRLLRVLFADPVQRPLSIVESTPGGDRTRSSAPPSKRMRYEYEDPHTHTHTHTHTRT